jgi:hypothetical protein
MYSLKNYGSKYRGHMGVFGWVRELKRKAVFEVSSYKVLGDKAGVSNLADAMKPGYHWGRKDGIIFYVDVDPEVGGDKYQNTVRALKAILSFKP